MPSPAPRSAISPTISAAGWLGRKFGRRRFFILAAIPLLPSFAIMWVAGQNFWYYLVTYVLFEMVYAMEIIPYETLASEMSTDYRTKAKFAGARILLRPMLGGRRGLPARMADRAISARIRPTPISTWASSSPACSWARPACSMRSAGNAPVPPGAGRGGSRRSNATLGAAFKALYRNLFSTLRIRAFRLHLGMYLGGYISQDIYNAAFTYFVIFALAGSTAIVANLVGVTYIVQFVAVILAINFALKLSPAAAYRMAAISFGSASSSSSPCMARAMARLRPCSGCRSCSPASAAARSTTSPGRPTITWPTSTRSSPAAGARARSPGVMTFVRKMSQAAAVILVGQVMQWSGFVSKATTQSPTAIAAIVGVMGLGTIAMLAFGIFVSSRFRLTPRTHGILMAEIEHLRAGNRTPSSAENAAIVEDLAGWRYDRLWGNNPVGGAH
jgi:oligogalacturonide transporter